MGLEAHGWEKDRLENVLAFPCLPMHGTGLFCSWKLSCGYVACSAANSSRNICSRLKYSAKTKYSKRWIRTKKHNYSIRILSFKHLHIPSRYFSLNTLCCFREFLAWCHHLKKANCNGNFDLFRNMYILFSYILTFRKMEVAKYVPAHHKWPAEIGDFETEIKKSAAILATLFRLEKVCVVTKLLKSLSTVRWGQGRSFMWKNFAVSCRGYLPLKPLLA